MNMPAFDLYDSFKSTGMSDDKARAAATALLQNQDQMIAHQLKRIRDDVAGLREELRTGVRELKDDSHSGQNETKDELRNAKEELRKTVTGLRWMIGINMTMTLALAGFVFRLA